MTATLDTKFDPVSYWAQRVGQGYDLSAVGQITLGAYNTIAYRMRLRALRRALAVAAPAWPEVSILDGGFGVGFYLAYYAREGVKDVTAIDVSEEAVRGARSRFPQYDVANHDLSDPLPFDRSYDVVTALDVLYHIMDDEKWAAALANLSQCVATGGALLFTEKFPPGGDAEQTAVHVRRRPLAAYVSILEASGMKVESIHPVFLLMDTPVAKGSPRWLALPSHLQWWIVRRSLSFLSREPWARDMAGVALAALQYPWERLAVFCLRRTPNTEIVVARRRPDRTR